MLGLDVFCTREKYKQFCDQRTDCNFFLRKMNMNFFDSPLDMGSLSCLLKSGKTCGCFS